MKKTLTQIQREIVQCQLCPRLVEYRQRIAQKKRRAFLNWKYWGKPVPSLGNRKAHLLIVGLAPAAHGANRTGRMFTGDRSGEFLFETLHRFGFCTQPCSRHRNDGLRLCDTYITAAIHCAPPLNKPTHQELIHCRHYLRWELRLLNHVRVVVVLGRVAWQVYLLARQELQWPVPRPRPKFGHAISYRLDEKTTLITSYHPSRQNTQTGRLTREMFEEVFLMAREQLATDRPTVAIPPKQAGTHNS
ncbi:uracil-DNA glycosylase [Acidobacteria bacterium AH-259-D05]|nr:uracil-DNA glycosylase [Acidobacteria bacterium AH-259-D05]